MLRIVASPSIRTQCPREVAFLRLDAYIRGLGPAAAAAGLGGFAPQASVPCGDGEASCDRRWVRRRHEGRVRCSPRRPRT